MSVRNKIEKLKLKVRYLQNPENIRYDTVIIDKEDKCIRGKRKDKKTGNLVKFAIIIGLLYAFTIIIYLNPCVLLIYQYFLYLGLHIILFR